MAQGVYQGENKIADLNVIEGVKVNGTDLTPDGSKKVDVLIPVVDVQVDDTSVLDNNGVAKIPAIPTVPDISTDIATDAASDDKMASPKAVATYAVQSLTAGGKKVWVGPQADYDLLTPDANTLYFITASAQ